MDDHSVDEVDDDSNDEDDQQGEECTPGRDNDSGNSNSCYIHNLKNSFKSFVSGSRRIENNNSSSCNINNYNHTFKSQTTETTPTTTNRSAADNNTQRKGASGNGAAIPREIDWSGGGVLSCQSDRSA